MSPNPGPALPLPRRSAPQIKTFPAPPWFKLAIGKVGGIKIVGTRAQYFFGGADKEISEKQNFRKLLRTQKFSMGKFFGAYTQKIL